MFLALKEKTGTHGSNTQTPLRLELEPELYCSGYTFQPIQYTTEQRGHRSLSARSSHGVGHGVGAATDTQRHQEPRAAGHTPPTLLPSQGSGGMGLPLRLVGGIPQGHVPWEPGVVLG